MSELADRIAEQLAEHKPSRWTSCSNGNEILRCCGQDFGRITGKAKRTDPDPYALWATHVAAAQAAYVREHFTDHAEELGLTRHNHYMAVPDETRTECACGSGNQPTRQVPAHRYTTELVRDE